jgi:hypothetical protein
VLWTLLWKTLEEKAGPQPPPPIGVIASPPPPSSSSSQSTRLPHSTRTGTSRQLLLPAATTTQADGTTWIAGILLAVWDNVAGPRVERAWLAETASSPPQENLHEIARDALAGTLEDNLVVKFVVLPHAGSVVVSAAFTAPYGDGGVATKLSIALFAAREHIHRATCMYRVVEDRLMYLALVARTVLTRCPDAALDRLGEEVCRAAAALDVAYRAGIAECADDGGGEAFGRAVFAASVAFGVDFVSRAITSHLQTRGFTVVVGPDEVSVNALVDTLAVFLDPRERALSARATPGSAQYHPDLVLQGVVGTLASAGIDEERLVHAPLPTTVVDLSSAVRNVW